MHGKLQQRGKNGVLTPQPWPRLLSGPTCPNVSPWSLAVSLPALLPVRATDVFRLLLSPLKQHQESREHAAQCGEHSVGMRDVWLAKPGGSRQSILSAPYPQHNLLCPDREERHRGKWKLGCRKAYGILCPGGCLLVSEGLSGQQHGFSVEDLHTAGRGPTVMLQ